MNWERLQRDLWASVTQKTEGDNRARVIREDWGQRLKAYHKLHYHNTQPIAAIEPIEELNIGHALISRAIFVGLDQAVREMLSLMEMARG